MSINLIAYYNEIILITFATEISLSNNNIVLLSHKRVAVSATACLNLLERM